MPQTDLKTAVVEIHQTLDDWAERTAKDPQSPFFFFVGAGISYPPVPLASDVEAQCRQRAERYKKNPPAAGCSALESYSHWFQAAFPGRQERQHFLRQIMESAVISQANFRLAHLLLSGRIAKLAVTANFDDLLTRALLLFGERPIVCDSPATVGRIDAESKDLKVLHVHGSFWAYDCCNLRGEIDARAQYSNDAPATMRSRLDSILHAHSPLVVGYSGWEGDVFMAALKNRLTGSLGTNLYWFCYRRESFAALPAWLKDHPDVRFVLPEQPGVSATEKAVRSPADASQGNPGREANPRAFGLATGDNANAALSATAVFESLIEELKPENPPLIDDPVGFFAQHLEKSLIGAGAAFQQVNDKYSILSIVERLKNLSSLEKHQAVQAPPALVDRQMEAFRNAVRQANYPAALQEASGMTFSELSISHLRELVSSLAGVDFRADGNWSAQVSLADVVDSASEVLAQRGDAEIRSSKLIAIPLLRKAYSLGALNRSEDAIAVYDEVIRRFGDAAETGLREQVAKALFNKGVRLGALDRSEEEIAVYGEVVRRFGEAAETELREQVAWALYNKGVTLGALSRSEEEIAAYDEVVRRFGEAAEAELREPVARALVNKGWTLGGLNRSEDAIALCDEVVRRFGEAPEPGLREQVATALFNKGATLEALSRNEDAVAVYDEVVRRFGEAAEPELIKIVQDAVNNRDELQRPSGDAQANPADLHPPQTT